MVWLGDIAAAAVIALLVFAASTDVAYRTIPNWIPAGIAVAGIAVRLIAGPSAFLISLAIALAAFAVMALLHARGMFGGGDVKLIAALCLGFAPAASGRFIFATAMAGGVLAAFHLFGRWAVRNRKPRRPPPRGSSFLRRIASVEIWRLARHGSLPYGVAIACGGIWTILIGSAK